MSRSWCRLCTESFGNPVKIDIDRTGPAAAPAADAGILPLQETESQLLMFHAKTQTVFSTRPEILPTGNLAMLGEKTVVPGTAPGDTPANGSDIEHVEAVAGRADSRAGPARQTAPSLLGPDRVL